MIVETDAPRGVNLIDENLISTWHVTSGSIPNTAEVNGKPVGLIEFTGNLHFDNKPHVKNIKVSSPNQEDTWIRGIEIQQNTNPNENNAPYYFIDSKISSEHLPEFSLSFFYNVQDHNESDVEDMLNPLKDAQGVFCFNYRSSEFVRMYTLKNKEFVPNSPTKYFDNTVPLTGTSLFVDGGPFEEPQLLVPSLSRNKTYNVVIRYAEPDENYTDEPEKVRYIKTEDNYDFGVANPPALESEIERTFTSSIEKSELLSIEHLIENIDIIDEYGAEFFNNVFVRIDNPAKITGSNSSYNSYAVGKRTWYLQIGMNGARWAYDGRHPFKRYNLYLKSWPGSRKTILVQKEIRTRDLSKGQFEVILTDLNSNEKTQIIKKVENHNYKFDWNKINRMSFGGGANSAIGGFRLYNKVLSDEEVLRIYDLNNPRFNQLGNTYP